MKRIARVLGGVFIALMLARAPVIGAETNTGAVYVTTLPGGADVWVDGTYLGRAPVLVDALLPGHHALTISKTGWAVQEVDVSIEAAHVAISSTRLTPDARTFAGSAKGTFVVRGAPKGATLDLDGVPLALRPGESSAVAAGSHRVVMTTARGRVTRTFDVLPDTTTEVVLAEPHLATERSGVVAPADEYLPKTSITIEGQKIVVRYERHIVVAHFGETNVRFDGAPGTYDGPPESIGGRLYLPLELLEKLLSGVSKNP